MCIRDSIAPTEDADIAKEMDRVQRKAGRTCITGVMAKSLVTKDGQAELTLGDGREMCIRDRSRRAPRMPVGEPGFGA